MTGQEALRRELEARLGERGDIGDQTVVAVVREVDLAAYAGGALAFALGLPPERAAAWAASLTRTVFLAGDPARIARRHPADRVAPGGSAAWFGPGRAADYEGLRLLLRAFEGEAPVPPLREPVRLAVPGRADGDVPRKLRLHLDAAGLPWREHLVHLNHALCEAALEGDLRPGDHLELTHDPAPGPPWLHARVGTDPRDKGRLRLFAALAPAGKEPEHGP